ncbi:SER/ARG-rich protein 34A [Hibiscus syriacus]|uniref:SER/ARG-rich protein 34A n=1 Tax=Hibiscus syriacus TaxID=106335 RepID=A0A6A3ANQ9_HIBSY|nr:SER/ARG-rich protein 34A [Hibiscus syriacus]
MASRFQAITLVDSPSYPNSIAWSDENLIAVASGHLVTVLNPALPFGPRGLISISKSEPYSIGVVKREDLASGCLLPTTLSRDSRPSVRSISWSHLGMAPNSGCLLAVCTTEGRVKLYRPPFCDFCADWIEVLDITDRLYDYLASISFEDPDIPPSEISSSRSMESEGRKSSHQPVPAIQTRGRPDKQIPEVCSLPLITADQYASRSAMLSSLVVAWSPLLKLSFEICGAPENKSSNCFSLLAVGSKPGKISLWRITSPQYYSVERSMTPTMVELIGILMAHSSWVTAISWALLASESSSHQVLLATGSSDGSVRIWVGHSEEIMKSTEVNNAPFYPLKEITNIYAVPVSVLSLMPSQSLHKMLLAVGRTSGAFEVWIGDTSVKKFNKVGQYDAHDQVVTGLAWAFDGSSLYSCSQDNFVRSWNLHGSSLSEVPIPSSSPGMRSFSDIPDVFISCLGLVVSPSNLAVAMVRGFDVNQLDPMYEARLQKAVVEFFWIGGQQKEILSSTSLEFDIEAFPGFTEKGLVYWESTILWSIICRRVILSELKTDEINNDSLNLGVDDANFAQDKLLNLWMELLSSSERELRERLVGLSFSTYKHLASSSSASEPGHWYPLGIAQMEQWAAMNNCHVHKQKKGVATKIKTYKRSRWRKSEEEDKERCSYCSALVPFDSPEVALCRGLESNDSNGQKHKLARCAVSMQVCPITTPLWQCKCCERWISNLAPESFFMMPSPSSIKVVSKPLCPLCGILVQRSQPEFLLSPLPV